MKTALKILGSLLGLLLLALGGLVAWVFATAYDPAPVESVEVDCVGQGQGLVAGQPFEVLSWNLQYGASRKHRFFYDGGEAVHVPPEDVDWTVQAISKVLRDVQPDLALLQEVDRDSTRTGNRDQLPAYAAAAAAACQAAAPYHQSPFVPAPSHQPLGQVHMALATLTRGPMTQASRIQLALLAEPAWRRVFNLKRAVLSVEVPVEGWSQPLAIANTHLSAFSHGDGTLEKQVGQLAEWIQARPADQPWILAGDMNLLPPGFDKNQLKVESDLYADATNPIEALLPLGTEVLGDQLAPGNRTYLPYGASEPDRKIDYMLVGGPIHVIRAEVLHEHSLVSDHLPVRATLLVGRNRLPPMPTGSATERLEAESTPAPATLE